MGWGPYWGMNPGFPWFMLIMPVMCLAMMFFFCRMGFWRGQARAANGCRCWNHHDRLSEEVIALRKEVELLKQKNIVLDFENLSCNRKDFALSYK